MLQWLESIGNFFIALTDFIIAFFRNVIEICILITKGFAYVTLVISYMPIQYQAILLAFVSFSVIVTILHFGG